VRKITEWLRGLSNNGTASGDSELKTAGFAGGHQNPHDRQHVSIEASGFLSALARHLTRFRE